MPWLELLVPALVLLTATPCVAVAYIYARSANEAWGGSLLAFLAAAAGVSLLTVLGIFLRASGLVDSFALYFAVWNLSFLALALASWFALRTALLAVASAATRLVRSLFGLGTAVAYLVTLAIALRGASDLYFPYIGGTYAATSFYLFGCLGSALALVLRRRENLSRENRGTLRRFLRVVPPLGAVFFLDELCRATKAIALPWPPLLPLAPLVLYAFAGFELARRMRRSRNELPAEASALSREELALSVARGCGASPLTLREREVLVELLGGGSNAEIADRLGISPNTVKNHIYSIFQKTGAGSRKELFLFALRGTSAFPSREAGN
ncbi:MAG: helix-turn-helix transcriptional regulator [Treponema sp.]|nr:helix-turn-helix transcriptional regulator [Treponema sp.]